MLSLARWHWQQTLWWRTFCVGLMVCGANSLGRAEDVGLELFEAEVRPVLVDKCSGCHGPEKREGGLRVDLLDALLTGGDSGAAVVRGDAAKSLLVKAIRHQDELEMPPNEELSERAKSALTRWIDMGAPWPTSAQSLTHSTMKPVEQAKDHWAFQPVRRPTVPQVADVGGWIQSPVDAFVLEKLCAEGLAPAAPADRRTLIRRVSYALTGLPPSFDDVQQFVRDDSPRAYADLVERLLASPQYGEHWGRHWLDVARYADTKGYVYAREERFWVHAWTYRDWVVRAFNEDLPYDRFLLLQLAADQVEDRRPSDLAAMGFLTLGRRFLGVERDIIDDRIDVVCRGTMGLTVACARCHDHKYDPIPTADYYGLYGVFDSSVERLEPLAASFGDEAFEAELNKRQIALRDRLAAARQESSDRVRARIADYLFAQSELHKYPANGFDQVFQAEDILPAFVRRWQRYLREAAKARNPVFTPWQAYAELPRDDFARQAVEVTRQLIQQGAIPVAIQQAFDTVPQSFREVCDRYGAVFAKVDAQYKLQIAAEKDSPQLLADATTNAKSEVGIASGLASDAPQQTSDASPKIDPELLAVLYGPQAPCEVPEGPVVLSETFFASAVVNDLWKHQGEVDRWIINSPQPAPHALTLVDQVQPIEPRIFVRGNPLVQGADVPRQFLSVLSDADRRPFSQGSGRYELAQSIIDSHNPLTARVIVNRVWAAHFGQGLVSTPSDFGIRAEAPSHPELLDWLADNLIAHRWSIKELQRWIVLSATYQQSSLRPLSDESNDKIATEARWVAASKLDPDNRLLWRMDPQRLGFEEFRDSLLAAAGQLETAIGGRPTDLFASPFPRRRTLYGLVDRQFLPGTLRMFDFANPDLHVAQRPETTVPGQALFFLNHPLLLERARALAACTVEESSPRERIEAMFQRVLQRSPTAAELSDSLELVLPAGQEAGRHSSIANLAISEAAISSDLKTELASPVALHPTADDWQYGYGSIDAERSRVDNFTPLPHFSGSAWQGGSNYPDGQLGWVQHTAAGGHPGNDLEHAAVRRWIAPHDGIYHIVSRLTHEPTVGDGIRASVVHSAEGVLFTRTVHHDSIDIAHSNVRLSAGQRLDFVVDIGSELNSDQYLWLITVEEARQADGTDGAEAIVWNSNRDFTRPVSELLDGWEQLAQVLLCSNEFLFVD